MSTQREKDAATAAARRAKAEEITLIPCVACGGTYEHTIERDGVVMSDVCAHCTRGAMTDAQLQAWKAKRTSRPGPI